MSGKQESLRSRAALAFACFAALASTQPLRADVAPRWFGTWALDRAHSHLVGPSVVIARTAKGYRFDFGAVAFDVGDDGRDYPTVPTRSTSLKRVRPGVWLRVHKINGAPVDQSTLRLSLDSKHLTIHTVAIDADGQTHDSDETLNRVAPGIGLAGTWRSSVAGVNVSRVFELADAGNGKIRWAFATEQQYFVVAPDGSAGVYQGAHAVPGVTVRLYPDGKRGFTRTDFVNGKPYSRAIDRLSADGGSMTETSWPVSRPDDRQQARYLRR